MSEDRNPNIKCLFTESDWDYWYKQDKEHKLWGDGSRYYCVECKIRMKNSTPLWVHLINAHNYSTESARIILNEINSLNDKIWKFRKLYIYAIEDTIEMELKFIKYRKNTPPEAYII